MFEKHYFNNVWFGNDESLLIKESNADGREDSVYCYYSDSDTTLEDRDELLENREENPDEIYDKDGNLIYNSQIIDIGAGKELESCDELFGNGKTINLLKDAFKAITIVTPILIIILSILDWRTEEHRKAYDELVNKENINIEVLSLISGDIKVTDIATYIDNNDKVIKDTTDVLNYNILDRIDLKTNYEKEVESYLLHTGRFGVEFDEIQVLESKCKDIANKIQGLIEINEKILVLGHGENIYIPCRIASYINGDVYFKSTTRSPIYCENIDGYPIKEKHVFYHKGVKYYFYNRSEIEKNYDKVILITEDDLNIKLTNNMIAVRV